MTSINETEEGDAMMCEERARMSAQQKRLNNNSNNQRYAYMIIIKIMIAKAIKRR